MPRPPIRRYVGPERRARASQPGRLYRQRRRRDLLIALLAVLCVGAWWPVGRHLLAVSGPDVEIVGTTRCTPLGAVIWLRTGEDDDEQSVALTGLHEAVHAAQCLRLGVLGSDRSYDTPAGMLAQEAEAYGRSMRAMGYTTQQCVTETTDDLDPSIYPLLRRLPADSIARTIRRWCSILPGATRPG